MITAPMADTMGDIAETPDLDPRAAGWRNRIVGSGTEAPERLAANPANWRVHPRHQKDALAGSLDTVGWVAQVLVNRRTGYVVDGHARVALALARKEASVPVLYVDLSPDEERLVLATFDPIGALAGADGERLSALLAEVTVDDAGLRALLDELAASAPRPTFTDPDDVPELADDPYIQPGDLWQLGRHRILCGDSTNAQDVARLLDGAKPALTVTDQPFGVSFDPSQRAGAFRKGLVTNDDRVDWREAWALSPSDVLYDWHSGIHAPEVGAGIEASGFRIRSQIIWSKPALVMGRGAYHWQHEPCFYAVREGATAGWIGDRKQSTIWEVPNVHRTRGTSDDMITDHGTQKPVEVFSRAIRNHTGDVYEPFAGSASCLLAAEQLGRRCYAMEIEPKYVQMAIERWQAYTGGHAERI
jgi:DNA modification methylase